MAHRAELTKPILPGKGATDYERYLHTDDLLALQKSPAELVFPPPATVFWNQRLSDWLFPGL